MLKEPIFFSLPGAIDCRRLHRVLAQNVALAACTLAVCELRATVLGAAIAIHPAVSVVQNTGLTRPALPFEPSPHRRRHRSWSHGRDTSRSYSRSSHSRSMSREYRSRHVDNNPILQATSEFSGFSADIQDHCVQPYFRKQHLQRFWFYTVIFIIYFYPTSAHCVFSSGLLHMAHIMNETYLFWFVSFLYGGSIWNKSLQHHFILFQMFLWHLRFLWAFALSSLDNHIQSTVLFIGIDLVLPYVHLPRTLFCFRWMVSLRQLRRAKTNTK